MGLMQKNQDTQFHKILAPSWKRIRNFSCPKLLYFSVKFFLENSCMERGLHWRYQKISKVIFLLKATYKSFVPVEVHTNYCRNTMTCLKFQVQLFLLTDFMVKTLRICNVSIFCCRSADIGKEFLFIPKFWKKDFWLDVVTWKGVIHYIYS